MNTLRKICIPILLLIFLLPAMNRADLFAQAQDTLTCAVKFKMAEDAFSKGQVDQIPGLLNECIKSGFTKEEALSAYKLLIQTLLLNDKLREADSSMLSFLRSNPEYKLSPTDHSSFVYLYNSFVVKPRFQLSVRTGVNIPFLTFVQEHLTSGYTGNSSYITNASNLFLSAEGKIRISPKLEFGTGVGFSQVTFTNSVRYYDFATVQYKESQTRLEFPVGVTFDALSFGSFTTYVRGGLGAALNVSTSADVSLPMLDKNNPYDRTEGTLKVKDSRIPIDIFAFVGTGFKFKIPKGYLFLEARGMFGMLNQNKSGGKNTELLQDKYYWSSPDFRLNTLNVNLGYTYIFYKPTKKQAQ